MPPVSDKAALQSGHRLLAEVAALPRSSRVLVALFLLTALVAAFPRGGPGALVVILLCAAAAAVLAWVVADPRDRPWVLLWALLAIAAREALVGAIDAALLARDLRWYAPDERVYVEHAHGIWRHWVDPSFVLDETDTNYGLWYVHWMARLYLVFGENFVVVKALNTFLGVASGLLGYRVMRNLGMPGSKWAVVLLLGFPSVAFWSALLLKDAYVIFFLIASLWAASEFVRSRNPLWLAAALLVLLPLQTVRLYMFVTGALALLAVPFALTRWRERLMTAAALIVSVYLLFAITQPFRDLGANIFYIPIFVRSEAAAGARSSFVQPRPVIQGEPGQRFEIAVESGATPGPATTPRVVEVEPGTLIVVDRPGVPSPTPPPGAASGAPTPAVVRPGDIVVIATPRPSIGATPRPPTPTPTPVPSGAPTPSPTPPPTPSPAPVVVVLEPEAKNTVGLAGQVDPDQTSFQGSLATNIRHLPTGIFYTLFAPFPWTASTLEQVATIPEMLVWYAALILAVLGFVVLFRRHDFRYAHGVAAIVGLVVLLSLISANVGTLIRSRAMLISFVLLLTGVGLDVMLLHWSRLARWRRYADSSQSPS